MEVCQIARYDWDLGSAPYELELALELRIGELAYYLPEHDGLGILLVDVVGSDFLQHLKIDIIWAAGSDLELFPSQESEQMEGKDVYDTLFEPAHLLVGLPQLGFGHEGDELFVVLESDLLLFPQMHSSTSLPSMR